MDTALPVLVDLFVSAKQIEGRTPKTTSWYRNMLSRFVGFMGGDFKLGNLTIDDARRFIADLQSKEARYVGHPISPQQKGGLSPHTIACYVRTLKVFSGWLYEEGFTKVNLFGRLKRPKLPEPMIEVLTDEEIRKIVDSINPNCFLGARMYAIVLLLLDTGIRASELATLTVENTHTGDNQIKVFGKGRKERMVPFAAATKKALLRYHSSFRPESHHHEFFLAADGLPLSYNGLKQMIDRLGKRAGVPRLHLHLFRHTFAVKYLMNGGDLVTLQRMLGHTTLQVTQMYLHLVDSDVKAQHAKFSPVDRLDLGSRRRVVRKW